MRPEFLGGFQFHKGTIKTFAVTDATVPKMYFNSIKVRLKQFAAYVHQTLTAFQFHKGTIKTCPLCHRQNFFLISIP